jgi:hypothetical protein
MSRARLLLIEARVPKDILDCKKSWCRLSIPCCHLPHIQAAPAKTIFFSSPQTRRCFIITDGLVAQVPLAPSIFKDIGAAFSSQLKSKCGHILGTVTVLRIILNIDDTPVESRSHTHPSHS